MKKILLPILLILTSIIFYGCNKNPDEESPVSLYPVDISSLKNKEILDIIYNKNLEEGVYQIITDKNNYIFFNGVKNKYDNINCKLEDKTLIITCTSSTSNSCEKLYAIIEKNTTSSHDKNIFFDKISLKINRQDMPLYLYDLKNLSSSTFYNKKTLLSSR